jgi:hypothetical protein
MIRFNSPIPDDVVNQWRYQLDRFVKENQESLAALTWGLLQEWGDTQEILGIDLKPQPHFICCPRQSLEQLNRKVDNQIQEVLGIANGYHADEEVVIIAIGEGQLKLIHFKPEIPPPSCFEKLETDLDRLIEQLEERMCQMISQQ